MKNTVRPIALSFLAPGLGFLLVLIFEMFSKVEVPKLLSAVINLALAALFAFVLFPKLLGIPFGKVATGEFLKRLGFSFPAGGWKHVVLGLVLAACTLSGMLVASILTGTYTVDTSTVNLPHLVFSLNPALWEELFYRGVIMVVLLRATRSLKRAFAIQVVLFGLSHIKGFDAWAAVDVVSVTIIAIGATYAAYQTRSLVAGIVFHYVHDALLFLVQLPGGTRTALFFGLLWAMVGIGCVITWLAANKLGVRAPTGLYDAASLQPVDAEGPAARHKE
jgi:hypothetical protein